MEAHDPQQWEQQQQASSSRERRSLRFQLTPQHATKSVERTEPDWLSSVEIDNDPKNDRDEGFGHQASDTYETYSDDYA